LVGEIAHKLQKEEWIDFDNDFVFLLFSYLTKIQEIKKQPPRELPF